MESKKDDGPEKARFVVVRDEIYNRYTTQQKVKDQVVSSVLKRSITQREEETMEILTPEAGDHGNPDPHLQGNRVLCHE